MTDEGGESVLVAKVKYENECPGGQYPDHTWGGRSDLLDTLADVLEGFDDPGGRANAAKAVGWIGGERALDPLCRAIETDPDPDVRNAAAWGLRSLGDAEAVATLRAVAAEDDDGDVRWQAARALAVVDWDGKPDYVEHLVREGDERAFDGFSMELRHEYVGDRDAVAKRLSTLAETVEDPPDLARALAGLGQFDGTTETLAAHFDHEDAAVRRGAVEGLREHDDIPLDRLASLGRSDPDPQVRADAVEVLGHAINRHDDGVFQRLRPFLDAETADVRAAAAHHLRFVDPPAHVPALVGLLADPDPSVRARATWALKVAGYPGAVPELLAAYPDPDPAVRENVCRALRWASGDSGRWGPSDFELFESGTVPTPDGTASREYDPDRTREVLEAGLYDEHVRVVGEAAHTLKDTGHSDAVDMLVALIEDGTAPTENRSKATYFLGNFGDSGPAREAHRRALSVAEPAVRAAAVSRAVRFSDVEEIDILLDALDDEAPAVRASAAGRARFQEADRLDRALEARLETETDDVVRFRLKQALGAFDR